MQPSIIVHGCDNPIGSRVATTLKSAKSAIVREVCGADVAGLRSCLPGAQAIAHCIVGTPAHIEQSAACLFGLLSESAATPRVVHLSSMTVYGSVCGIVDESNELIADLGPYSRAQRSAEQCAAAYPRAVILRSGVEYGPTCVPWSERVARWLLAGRLGDLGVAGDGICNLVYVDDLISVILTALREPEIEGGIFNVAAAEKPTWNEYFTAYALTLGAVPVRRIGMNRLRIETRIAAPALRLAQLAVGVTGLHRLRVPPPIPPSLLSLCRQEIDLSVVRVEQVLRARWTPLQQGLSLTAECYR